MNSHELLDLIAKLADEFDVPGIAAGVWHAGETSFACHGVTSIENPLPIDVHTLFQAGSIGKTYTATALLRLAETGRVELDAPVRRYVPALHLADATAAAQVTLLQLLNHTAGWEGDFFVDTGEGEDALARYVSRLDEVAQLTPPGSAFSYNNAAFCLAGRVIENVTGDSYERAIRKLLLLALMTNASPGGLVLNRIARQRVLAACTGIIEEDPRPVSEPPGALAAYAGEYRARGMRCLTAIDEAAGIMFTLHNDPELLAQMFENGEVPPSQPTILHAGLVAGHADRYVFASGPAQGLTGYFVRDGDGRVRALHLFGRWLPRLGD
jgi:CubicO group peptidase (beta-lactamase class C family)